jgi:hypothetical protein
MMANRQEHLLCYKFWYRPNWGFVLNLSTKWVAIQKELWNKLKKSVQSSEPAISKHLHQSTMPIRTCERGIFDLYRGRYENQFFISKNKVDLRVQYRLSSLTYQTWSKSTIAIISFLIKFYHSLFTHHCRLENKFCNSQMQGLCESKKVSSLTWLTR